jgi:peptide chain release factor subunit 1
MPASDPTKVLNRLARMKPGRQLIVSCYLKLEPRDRARGKYLVKFKNRQRLIERSLDWLMPDRADRDTVLADLARVREYLSTPAHLPATQGIAIFASRGLGLFEVLPLPRVHRSRLAVDRTPLVRELAALEDEVGRLLTVVVDRNGARLFEVSAFDAKEVARVKADSTRGKRFHGTREDASGTGEHAYHRKLKSERQQHFDEVARTLFERHQRTPVHGLVIAGTGPDASALEPYLHPYLTERLLGVAHLNPKEATPALVHAATVAVREAYRRAAEHDLIHDLAEAEGRGWAVNGIAETLRALARGQVRTLLVAEDEAVPGFRLTGSGRLTLSGGEGRGEGEAIPVLDLIDDAIEEALRQRVTVEVLAEEESRARVAGLAALFRFR